MAVYLGNEKVQITLNSNIGVTSVEPEEDDIPKVFFGGKLPSDKNDVIMSFRYVSKTRDIRGYCKTKAQGSSSLSYPKKNQTVKLYKDAACTEKMKVNFKGWGEQNKFCFKANWIDLTHARNIVSARLWVDVVKSRSNYAEIPELLRGSPNQGAIDGFPVKVYAKGVYQGRYTINIPKDAWMANMDDELDNHCILCGESHGSAAALFRGQAMIDESDWSDEIHDVVPDAIKTRWNEIISFVINSTDDEFFNGIGNYFDVSSLIDYYLFGIVSCNFDGYGKNQIFMTYDGQRWFASAYDLDATWGLWWNGEKYVSYDWARNQYQDFQASNGNLLYIRLAQLFGDKILTRWDELKNGALSIDNILNRFEEFIGITPPWLIDEDYADTTANGNFINIPSQTTNNLKQIRQYIVDRLSWCTDYIYAIFSIPRTYTPTLFVQSDGRQYIDTEISGGTNAEYEIVFDPSTSMAVTNEHFFAGQHLADVPKLYFIDNGVLAESNGLRGAVWSNNGLYNTGRSFKINYTKNGEISQSGNLMHTGTISGHGWGDMSWYIFASHEDGLMSSMRLYSLKMWKDGRLVRMFIPAVRNSDGVAGLYDVVSSRFFCSNTDTELTAFTGFESEYRPSVELPDGYEELVIDETSGVNIPSFVHNPSAQNRMTHLDIIIPNLNLIAPDILYSCGDVRSAQYIGQGVNYSFRQLDNGNHLTISLPTNIVGKTLDEVNMWLKEHHIIFYIQSDDNNA